MSENDAAPTDEAFWSDVRDQFPLLRDRIYFNTSTMGICPQSVLHAVREHMEQLEQSGDSGHSAALWREVKEGVGQFLNCSAEEIAFTRNTTEGSNIVCNGLQLQPGDEIITSSHEHVGNTITWLARAQRDGLSIRVFEPANDGQKTVERIEALLSKRTRAISIPHVSCASGQVLPVENIGQIAKTYGLFYFVDGAQALGCTPVDLQKIGCHAYATSGHKWLLGPNGTGFLFVHRDWLDRVQATHVGAYSNAGDFSMETGMFSFIESAQRYEYGTINASLIAGLGAVLSFWQTIGADAIWQRNRELTHRLAEGLHSLGAQLLTTTRSASILSFGIPGVPYADVQSYLWNDHRIRLRGIYEGGLNALRASIHLYNTPAEVDRALGAIEAAMNKLRP